ncbi:hypothetical protein [Nibrella viscosa]|uniref:hypothetical protein n=1 Tax=Nibrella viscosa TaxID=1084524 RepID=UPI0031ED8FF4
MILFSLLPFGRAYAQRDTSHYRTVPVPAHLRPIERAVGSSALGSVYYYGGKRLTSPHSLEVPFYELDDPMVNRHYRNYRTWTTVSRLTAVVPLLYVFTRNTTARLNSREYWAIYFGSLGASLGFTIIGNTQVNKAVMRYNQMLRQSRLGVSAVPIPMGGQAVGLGYSRSF